MHGSDLGHKSYVLKSPKEQDESPLGHLWHLITFSALMQVGFWIENEISRAFYGKTLWFQAIILMFFIYGERLIFLDNTCYQEGGKVCILHFSRGSKSVHAALLGKKHLSAFQFQCFSQARESHFFILNSFFILLFFFLNSLLKCLLSDTTFSKKCGSTYILLPALSSVNNNLKWLLYHKWSSC